MQSQGAPIADRTPDLIPPIVCDHPDDVAEVRTGRNYSLWVKFFDGTEGTVEMSALIHSPNAVSSLSWPIPLASRKPASSSARSPGLAVPILLPIRCTLPCANTAFGSPNRNGAA